MDSTCKTYSSTFRLRFRVGLCLLIFLCCFSSLFEIRLVVRSVNQAIVSDVSEVSDLLSKHFPVKSDISADNEACQSTKYIIVKPVASAASQDVYLCERKNEQDIKDKGEEILTKVSNNCTFNTICCFNRKKAKLLTLLLFFYCFAQLVLLILYCLLVY